MAKNHFKQLFRDLRNKLKVIAGQELTLLECFNDSMSLINAFLLSVRIEVMGVAFNDQFEEIYFFKFEKPEYYALKIYHVALFNLCRLRPTGPSEVVRTFFLSELGYIARFFKQHAFYYEYFRSGFTEMDEVMFVRGALAHHVLAPDCAELDPDYSTNGDHLFAQFMAFELLQEYICGELKSMDDVAVGSSTTVAGRKWFDWTGEVIHLIELGYGIYVSKQLNKGKAKLQDIFNWLEESFGLEIGIPANRFRDIKRRKRLSRTHFTDLMRDALIAYMDDSDEFKGDTDNGN